MLVLSYTKLPPALAILASYILATKVLNEILVFFARKVLKLTYGHLRFKKFPGEKPPDPRSQERGK